MSDPAAQPTTCAAGQPPRRPPLIGADMEDDHDIPKLGDAIANLTLAEAAQLAEYLKGKQP